MATTDTVLQPGSEDLSAFTGPAGPQGPAGPTGPAGPSASNDMLSILVTMFFNGNFNDYQSGSTVIQYIISGGPKFQSTGSFLWTTGIASGNSLATGQLTNFLATATDPYTVTITNQKVVYIGNTQPGPSIEFPVNVHVYNTYDNQIIWRVGECNAAKAMGPAMTLAHIASPNNENIKEIHFSLLITA